MALCWPVLCVNRSRVEDAALQTVGPAPDGVGSMIGSQLMELIDPLQKSADRARVNVEVVVGDSADQAMPVARQGQDRCPQRRVLGVNGCVQNSLWRTRDSSPDGFPSWPGDC
jgi:hypothetical protein